VRGRKGEEGEGRGSVEGRATWGANGEEQAGVKNEGGTI